MEEPVEKMSLAEIWNLGYEEIEKILKSQDYELSPNQNYDRAVAAIILYNEDKLTHQDRVYVENPNFLESMTKTRLLVDGIAMLFHQETNLLFDEEFLAKELYPYYNPNHQIVYIRENNLDIVNSYDKKIHMTIDKVAPIDTVILNFTIINNIIYLVYRDVVEYFKVLDFYGKVLYLKTFHNQHNMKIIDNYIYLYGHELIVLNLSDYIEIFRLRLVNNIEAVVGESGNPYIALCVSYSNNIYIFKDLTFFKMLEYGRIKTSRPNYHRIMAMQGVLQNELLYVKLVNGTILIFNILTGQMLKRLVLYHYHPGGMNFIIYKNFLIASDFYTTIKVLNLNTGLIIRTKKINHSTHHEGSLIVKNDILYLSCCYYDDDEILIKFYDLTHLATKGLKFIEGILSDSKDAAHIEILG